jgi:hypothetical protein|tara:strand:- start:1567 stop:2271 length:705 start_codon:yes stop_codon:yes gene_type:complete
MKISDETIVILKNLATFNNHLVVKAGNVISTVNEKKSTLIKIVVPEEFPVEFALHDLSGLLKTIGLFEDPEFIFGDNSIVISDSSGTTQEYYYSDKDKLIWDERDITFPECDISVTITCDVLKKVIKAAGINGFEDIAVVGEGGKVFLRTLDKEKATGDNLTKSKRTFSVLIAEEDKGEFTVFLKHMKKGGNKLSFLPLDYELSISNKKIVRFASTVEQYSVSYIMGIEADSVI